MTAAFKARLDFCLEETLKPRRATGRTAKAAGCESITQGVTLLVL